MGIISKMLLMAVAGLSIFMTSCSVIDEGDCRVEYVMYQYRNNIGVAAPEHISKMTDFVFSAIDSTLRFVEGNITNGRMLKRPITLPDGEWIVVSYGNLNGGSEVNYTIGLTKLSEMSTRVINRPSYNGSYSSVDGETALRIGNSDKLYFGKVDLTVKGGYTDRIHTVDMSNVHIWLAAMVKWKDATKAPTKVSNNLHVRLQYVPVEHSFLSDAKVDKNHSIPYLTPRVTAEKAAQIAQLEESSGRGEFSFNTYGLRWERGKAPTLTIYDGESLLVNKSLDLNKYFNENNIDLTNTRVQFYNLKIEVDGDNVAISEIGIEDWEDGGSVDRPSSRVVIY